MPQIEVGNYLVIDPEVYHGELTFTNIFVKVLGANISSVYGTK